MTATSMVAGDFDDLDEDDDSYIFTLTDDGGCDQDMGGSCAALQAGYNELLFDTGAARSVCLESFEPEVPCQQSHEVFVHHRGLARPLGRVWAWRRLLCPAGPR